MKTIVPDTGALIDGRITERVQREEKARVVISEAVVAELEFQANAGRETGFAGLEELKRLTQLAKKGVIDVEFAGERPSAFEIERAQFGEIDAKIRGVAKKLKGVLITTDKVQTRVAEAEGIDVEYLEPIHEETRLDFEKFFDAETLSVHLKEGLAPRAKRGLPGNFRFQAIAEKPVSRKELETFVRQAVEYAKRHPRSYIELEKRGATVLQIGPYRVTYTKPPFSESTELTIVRPIAKLSLGDYQLSPAMQERLSARAEGVLIAGPPGSGKSTFASALAESYAAQNKVVKTLEQPRDLQVGPDVTQYAPLEGSFELTADVLLLVRPDYTVYDEVRKPDDFRVFADLRMAGIGMVGVVHASKAIDAVQRFIGKIDLGMIPQVIDTILFIAKGRVAKAYELAFTVKAPSGMNDPDLARPVIEVRDFETQALEFEIYKFGDETVVFPVALARTKRGASDARRGRERGTRVHEGRMHSVLSSELGRNYEARVEGNRVVLLVPEHLMGKLVGKKGSNIARLEKKIGARIDVRAKE